MRISLGFLRFFDAATCLHLEENDLWLFVENDVSKQAAGTTIGQDAFVFNLKLYKVEESGAEVLLKAFTAPSDRVNAVVQQEIAQLCAQL